MFLSTGIIFFLLILQIIAYNIDVNFPIIYEYSLKNGRNKDRSSYFGYSVMLYGGGESIESSWIKIGAPRGNWTGDSTIEPGTVFHCPIMSSCDEINFYSYGSHVIKNDNYIEKIDNAWIGVDMDVDEKNNRTIICGHRWINANIYYKDYYMQGICYYNYNEGKEKIAPLNVPSYIIQRSVYNYGLGQAGASVTFPNAKRHQEVHIGAPGMLNWQGNSILYVKKNISVIANRRKRDTSFISFETIIPNGFENKYSRDFDLLGYDVASGYFFSDDFLLYVSGSPRANDDKGQVLIFEYPEYNLGGIFVRSALKGSSVGEYFGSALAVGDITGDGYDDLIVGAPMFFTEYEEGRIYVYLGNEGITEYSFKMGTIIDGKVPGGRFGSALSAGDFNQDGFADIIVGAPYENELQGAVYIYYGSRDGLVTKTRQRITASSIDESLRGFGISFSRLTDIDKNYCNDIAIGAYLSEQAVILRSYPVVKIHTSATASLYQISRNETSFDVDIYVKSTAQVEISPIDIKITVNVDDNHKRAYLKSGSNENIYTTHIKLDKEEQRESLKVYLKDKILNYIYPFEIHVQVSHIQKVDVKKNVIKISDSITGLDNDGFCKTCPVLDETASIKTAHIILPFTQECGDDNRCDSNLSLKAEFRNLDDENKYLFGSQDSLQLDITISNTGEVAHLLEISVILPEDVSLTMVPTECDIIGKNVICSLGNLKENSNETFPLNVNLKNFKLMSTNDIVLKFNITITTKSFNTNDKNNNVILKLDLKTDANIILSGKSEGDGHSFVVNKTENVLKNVTFNHLYEIEKTGVSPIYEVDLKIYVPVKYHYNKNTYEIASLSTYIGQLNDLPFICQQTKFNDALKSGDKSKSDQGKFEKYTETSLITQETPPLNRTLYLNCSTENVECAEILCTSIGPFMTDGNIAKFTLPVHLNALIISEKLLEQKDIIHFSTKGVVNIKKPFGLEEISMRPHIIHVFTFINAGFRETTIDSWIYILAIIVGLLLLSMVIAGLVKLGFFKRKTKSKLMTMKTENSGLPMADMNSTDDNKELIK